MAGIKAERRKKNKLTVEPSRKHWEPQNVVSKFILTLIYFPTTCDVYLGRAGIYRKRKDIFNYTKVSGNKC